MSGSADVVIVGGGVIGLTTAYFLAKEGVRVTLADQGEPGQQASWAGAGILVPGNPSFARTPLEQLRCHGVRLYPGLSAELRERTGLDNGYTVCGGVELPEDDGPRPPTEEWYSEGTPFTPLDYPTLRQQTGGLVTRPSGGVWLPDVAQVRNPWHVRALRAACEAQGVTLLPNWPVRVLVRDGERVVAAEGEAGRLVGGQYLLAGGAWTPELLAPLGVSLPVRPVRGQMVLLRLPPRRRPIVLQGKRYLVPRPDGLLLVGSTEEEVGFDARPTAGGVGGLIAFALTINPGLGAVPVEKAWAGLRPGSADGLPYLGPVPGCSNLHVAAGHFRSGLQLSPSTGLVMTQHLLGRPTLVPLGPFAVGR